MALRNQNMSLYNSDQSSERWHLLRKVVLLFLLVVAISLGLVILFRQKSNFPILLFNVLADTLLGLLIGLGTRFVLRQLNWFIQGVAAAAMVTIGLAVLGYFTNWRTGIGPWEVGFVRLNWLNWAHISLVLPLQLGRSQMDLIDLAQLVIGIDTAWIALRAWKRSTRIIGQNSNAPLVRSRTRARPAPVAVIPNVSISSNHSPAVSSARAKVKKKRSTGRPVISMRKADPRPSRSRSRAWNPGRRKPELQIAVYEEHRCPYCLELVTRNDPRGSVECQVCHALHHKDCWDITGTCQVPHLNT